MVNFARGVRGFVILFVAVYMLVIGVSTASASHYRYQTVSWERDLTFQSTTLYKVHVTMHGGWRWSYPFTWSTNNNLESTATYGNCTFVPSSNTFGRGGCPPPPTSIHARGPRSFSYSPRRPRLGPPRTPLPTP